MTDSRHRADRTLYERGRRKGVLRRVVATPAIEHLQILRAEGRTWPELERLSGYDGGHLRSIAEGRYARIGKEMAEDILSIPANPPTHTNWRTCDCDPCRFRVRAYNRYKVREYRANPGPRLTDPAPALAHVRALQAEGWTLRRIAATAGYSRDTILSLSSGRRQSIGASTAADILAIPLGQAVAA